MSSHLWWVHAHYSPQFVEQWTYVSSPLLYSHPPGQEQVPLDEAWEGCRDEFVSGLGRRLPVNFGCWIVVFIWCNYLSILYRTPLYIKDVTFISVPCVTICVRLDPSTLGDYFRARVLVPLEPECDRCTPESYCSPSGAPPSTGWLPFSWISSLFLLGFFCSWVLDFYASFYVFFWGVASSLP
jgi:hypothetical protein